MRLCALCVSCLCVCVYENVRVCMCVLCMHVSELCESLSGVVEPDGEWYNKILSDL